MIYDVKSEEIKEIEKNNKLIEELEEGYRYLSFFPY